MFGIVGFTESVIAYREPGSEDFVAIDRATGEVLWTEDGFDNILTGAVLSDRGMEALLGDGIAIVDIDTWDVRRISYDLERPRGWEFSPAGDRVAVGAEDRFVILDAETGAELQRIPVPGVSDIHWIDESTVVIGSKDGLWAKVSLDTIDLCPDLDELREG